ncbi:MAG: electron transport complex subunit RsxC [Saprospiraceae bacterium]|nr:electron transport complex subunit RsxC [Saprospiraceae bacterium]MCB9322357.1 electron transport complex subunit RsxC [Lewinellaceae bacterium]
MLKTFPKGGIHPADNKLSANMAIEPLPLPVSVSIPISQHIGAPAEVIVEKKQKVKVGEVIATAKGFVSSNIHATVSGTVTKIDTVLDSSGYKRQAVTIRVKDDEWVDGVDLGDELIKDFDLTKEEIVRKIMEAGVVGLGGAAFPSHVKLAPPKGKHADILIVNGVECEPFLTADHRLMVEKPEQILVGIDILKKALDVKRVGIGVEANTPDAVKIFEQLTKDRDDIKVYPLQVKYPQGGEKQLIKAVTGQEVPAGGLPIDVGAIVHNVGTVFSVYEAIQKNKPLVERVVTITGKSLARPANFKVRIGTSVADLIEAAGGMPEDTGKIINGGPMMGKSLSDVTVPITKGTSGILLVPEEETRRGKVKTCIRCSRCVSVCPMGLEPYLLMTLVEKKLDERARDEDLFDCIECGSCNYICPSNRPLLDYIRLGKKVLK